MNMFPEPQEEHRWLQKLLGSWTFEGECSMGPDQPPMKSTGTETVRALGALWTLGESTGEMPGGGVCTSIMTLGYDPAKKRFVGSFVASVMTHLWTYEGTLDASRRILTLDTEGPDMSAGGKMVKYQDIMEFVSDSERTLTSRMQADDGTWHEFMKARYQRTD